MGGVQRQESTRSTVYLVKGSWMVVPDMNLFHVVVLGVTGVLSMGSNSAPQLDTGPSQWVQPLPQVLIACGERGRKRVAVIQCPPEQESSTKRTNGRSWLLWVRCGWW